MEIGRVAEIDNAKTNNVEKLSKVSNLDQKNKVDPEDEYKKAGEAFNHFLDSTEHDEII